MVQGNRMLRSKVLILSNCAAECNHYVTACLGEPDVEKLAHCIKLDIDCADICLLTAAFV